MLVEYFYPHLRLLLLPIGHHNLAMISIVLLLLRAVDYYLLVKSSMDYLFMFLSLIMMIPTIYAIYVYSSAAVFATDSFMLWISP